MIKEIQKFFQNQIITLELLYDFKNANNLQNFFAKLAQSVSKKLKVIKI